MFRADAVCRCLCPTVVTLCMDSVLPRTLKTLVLPCWHVTQIRTNCFTICQFMVLYIAQFWIIINYMIDIDFALQQFSNTQ